MCIYFDMKDTLVAIDLYPPSMLIEHGIEPLPAAFTSIGVYVGSCYSMQYLRCIHNDVIRENARARERERESEIRTSLHLLAGRRGELELVPFRLALSVCVLSLVRSNLSRSLDSSVSTTTTTTTRSQLTD